MRAWGRVAALGAIAAALGGCSGATSDRDLSPVARVLLAGTTVPPPMLLPNETAYCPPISVMEGGSLIQSQTAVITLGELARECAPGPNGSTIVKVGISGRVVLGGAGGGRQDVPIRVAITQGDRVLTSRGARASVALPAGETFGTFAIVEEGILVPAAAAEEFDIEVGLGGSAPPARRRR